MEASKWLVVRTKSRQEQRAVEHLENQSFHVYCPWLVRENGTREPLFAGYLFVENGDQIPSFGTIRSTRGVLGLVKNGGKWVEASGELIEAIKAQEQRLAGSSRFTENQKVWVTEGPFAGLEAMYLNKRGEDRALVLLQLLQRQQRVTVPERILLNLTRRGGRSVLRKNRKTPVPVTL